MHCKNHVWVRQYQFNRFSKGLMWICAVCRDTRYRIVLTEHGILPKKEAS